MAKRYGFTTRVVHQDGVDLPGRWTTPTRASTSPSKDDIVTEIVSLG